MNYEKVDKRRSANKKKFLELIENNPVVSSVCRIIGIERSTYYRWIEEDIEFKMEIEKRMGRGIELVNDIAESHLIKGVKNGDMSSIKMWLPHNYDKYRNNRPIEVKTPEEYALTEEEERNMALAAEAWSDNDYEDERPEDYECKNEEEIKELKEIKEKLRLEREMLAQTEIREPRINKKIARRIERPKKI